MRKLSKKISMLMVLAMLVGLFSGVVSASAASAWSFTSSKYDVAVNGSINMESKEYADFDLLKDGKAPAGYTVAWASSDEDVVWVNAKTGQLRANKFGKAADGDKAVISATFTNTATKKSATRSFTIVLGAAKADFTVEADDVTIALGEEVKFAPVVKNADGKVVKFATHKSYNGYFLDGKAITNPWTPEEAGEYTVTVAQFAKKADVDDLAKAVRKDEVKVTVTVDADFDAKATGVKEITVYGNFAADAKFTVKKNSTQNVSFTATVAEDGKTAKLALVNRITKGTYTVSYGDAKVDLALEDEKVESITIFEKDSQIFTDSTKNYVYIHYDVLNQYGQSVRKSFDVDWSHNADAEYRDDKASGILILYQSEDFEYNDVVVLTGVVSGYGFATSETAQMKVGLERNISSVKVLGLVKDDSTELVQEIAAGFTGQYWLVFEMYDRAGYVIEYPGATTILDDLKFISLNPLLAEIYEDENNNNTPAVNRVYIDGVAYAKILLEAGRAEQIKKGGVAEIAITSTKTGVNSPYTLRVASEQILDEFRILAPETIVSRTDAEGKVTTEFELGYEAIDTTGASITDFRALYKAVSFGDDDLVLEERNDGTAKLHYTATDVKAGIDYDTPVILTAIVQGTGKSSNLTLNVKPDREATSVAGLVEQNGGCAYILEGNSIDIDLIDNAWNGRPVCIQFNDQYDEMIKKPAVFGAGTDARFLAIKPVENTYDFVSYQGAAATYTDAEEVVHTVTNSDGYMLFGLDDKLTLTAGTNVTTSQKEVVLEVAIADAEGKIVGGSDKTISFYVVDINNCVDFTANPCHPEGDAKINFASPISYEVKALLSNGKSIPVKDYVPGIYQVNYTVNKQYSTNIVASASGGKVAVSGSSLGLTSDPSGNSESEFNDHSEVSKNPDGSKKKITLNYEVTSQVVLANGKVKAKMTNLFEIGDTWTWASSIATKNYGMGKHSWAKENTEGIVRPINGYITKADLMVFVEKAIDNWGSDRWGTIDVSVTKLVDGGKGIHAGGPVLGTTAIINDEEVDVIIAKAEIGDTFLATFFDGGAKHEVIMTVGADQNAKFSDSKTDCTWR